MQAVRDLDAKAREVNVVAHSMDSHTIEIGVYVRYAQDKNDIWNTDRWGIVTGITDHEHYGVTVQVTPVFVLNKGEVAVDLRARDEWYADPQGLVVL